MVSRLCFIEEINEKKENIDYHSETDLNDRTAEGPVFEFLYNYKQTADDIYIF
jgi:hypothetical protein